MAEPQTYSKEEVDLIRLDDKLGSIGAKCDTIFEMIKNDLAQKHEIEALRKDLMHTQASLKSVKDDQKKHLWALLTMLGSAFIGLLVWLVQNAGA